MATKVIVAEDEPLFRQMLRSQLSTDSDIEIIGEASNGEEAVELAKNLVPEVILMDIEMGSGISGIQAGHIIKAENPSTGIVLLSNYKAKQFIVTSAGWSYLMKRNVRDIDTVVRAIKGAAWGMLVIDPQLTEALKPRENTLLSRLTGEQMKVLELVAQGFTDKAIAEELVMDENAVRSTMNLICKHLEIEAGGSVASRVLAVRTYLDQTRGL